MPGEFSDAAEIAIQGKLLARHVVKAAEIHVMHASRDGRAHYVQIPIVLRAIYDYVRAVQQLRQMRCRAYIGKRGARDAAAELARDFLRAEAIEIGDDDALHFARAAEVEDYCATHQSRA
jgi:hypothetical protein